MKVMIKMDKNKQFNIVNENNQIEPQFPGQTLPLSNNPKDVAWAVFQKYLEYNICIILYYKWA